MKMEEIKTQRQLNNTDSQRSQQPQQLLKTDDCSIATRQTKKHSHSQLSSTNTPLDHPVSPRFTACSNPAQTRLSIETSLRRPSLNTNPHSTPPPTHGLPTLRRARSVSYFVDLLTPASSSFPAVRPSTATKELADRSAQLPSLPLFPLFSKRPSPQHLEAQLAARMTRAENRRAYVLHERRSRLRRRFEQIRYRILLQQQRERLTSLKIQARSEYAISAANLKRQLILKRNMDRCGAAVEHAQNVAMLHKLRKFMELRRSFSETFVELLTASHTAGGVDMVQSGTLCRATSFLDGLNIDQEDEEEEYKTEDIKIRPPTSPVFGHTSPKGGKHVDLPALRGLGAAMGSSDGDAMVSNSLRASTAETESQPSSGQAHAVGTEGLSGKEGYAASHGTSGDESPLGIDSFSSSGDFFDESLSATVKRLKVLPVALLEDLDETAYLQFLDLLPPITRFTLRELDLTEILSNAQLRHDLFFDPELQFKPNLDGEKGEQKREAGDLYWRQVETEVADGHLYRLPLLLFEIRYIMMELLPYTPERRDQLERNLDVRLLAQQMQHGVLNAVALVDYIAGLLKANCAPARDDLVDAMVQECRDGNFVRTLRACFEILELMKLDYANHQLHRIRPYVVEHAPSFEWRWFKDQYEVNATKLDETISWLNGALCRRQESGTESSNVPPKIQQLHTSATLHLISQSHLLSAPTSPLALPETYRMDVSRLVQYYNDWQDITIVAALLVLFRQSCGNKCTPEDLRQVKRVLWILLNDHETSMHHVTLQMCDTAGKIRGKPFTPQETTMLSNLVESTLQPESKLYEIIRVRIGSVLERLVKGDVVDVSDLAKVGLGELEDEVAELGERVRRLVSHNWRVFGNVYVAIIEELTEGEGNALQRIMKQP